MTTSDPARKAFEDQIDAAASDLASQTNREMAILQQTGYYGPGFWNEASSDELPAWIHEGWREAFEPWTRGEARTCEHTPNVFAPQPVYACAWRPGPVVCADCQYLFAAASVAEDRTCDGCGRVTAGPEKGDPICAGGITKDFMSYRVGLCRTCTPEPIRSRVDWAFAGNRAERRRRKGNKK
jgi:hypothetical protein